MLYVTPMELSKDKREERQAFCAKLNGLPPNANAREYQSFIEEFNVLEFRIPRNTRTNRTQLYAYVYFKDEESMQRGTDRVIVRRNKQHEWTPPDVKSCFNCGFTSHLISECNYKPPRKKPINKREYLNSIRQYQPGYHRRQTQDNVRPGSYADALRTRPNNARYDRGRYSSEGFRQDNPYRNRNRPWNRNNIYKRAEESQNYGDDEKELYEWGDEEYDPENIQRSKDRANTLSRPRSMKNRNSSNLDKINNNESEIQEIKGDLAVLQDMVKNLARSLEQTTTQISQYMQTTNISKGKDKVIDKNNNDDMILDNANTKQQHAPKRRMVSFNTNENNKRPQNEDTSDSDSNDNRQNNMALLTAQLKDLHNGMAAITQGLTNINNRITKVDNNKQILNKSADGAADLSTTTTTNNNFNDGQST
ncbi:uncharacterized protein OCT59_009815 [Rhizophagus irregularis]|uniref:RRM domain-containing protein n=1 Tax=Rhizophagus irregularis (strain DAOM 197198w) TaxID=1432141 RepID=A0A015LSQ2_RHIIW|nr:hypothetical protein RirG_204740 [Rhizophagus irregularis DAOM 197198w]UZO18502.1 hypothetical protein OCT59_009815 [Rhizophagus irregularis]GBC29204.1 hypothetical protein GLOIN_2v1475602 [Rhizophagus irregularis DAOM 181602=DAOM 197198]